MVRLDVATITTVIFIIELKINHFSLGTPQIVAPAHVVTFARTHTHEQCLPAMVHSEREPIDGNSSIGGGKPFTEHEQWLQFNATISMDLQSHVIEN